MQEIEKNLYDVLEVDPSSTFDDIQKSYIRLKNTYVSSNQALYSLMSPESQQEILNQIEQAYEVLSNPATREKYDTSSGGVPLVAGDTQSDQAAINPTLAWEPETQPTEPTSFSPDAYASMNELDYSECPISDEALDNQSQIEELLVGEDVADGKTFQKVRERLNISPNEIFSQLQISQYYLRCIEENDFDQLPRKVYLNGFLKMYLRYIGIPDVNATIQAYLSRFQVWWNQKTITG